MSATETEAKAVEVAENRNATLSGALVAALAELTVIGKGRTANAGSYSYTYADLGDVVAETRPILAQHGLVGLTPVSGHPDGVRLQVTPILIHRSGERMDFEPFPFTSPNDPRATGSNVTYFRRYALLAALGIATGDDDDGAAASEAVARGPQPEHHQSTGPSCTVCGEPLRRPGSKAVKYGDGMAHESCASGGAPAPAVGEGEVTE